MPGPRPAEKQQEASCIELMVEKGHAQASLWVAGDEEMATPMSSQSACMSTAAASDRRGAAYSQPQGIQAVLQHYSFTPAQESTPPPQLSRQGTPFLLGGLIATSKYPIRQQIYL